MARIGEGRCLIYFGEVAEGLAVLDEAMVAVEAREIPPTSVGDAYCTVIDACAELFDVRRCETWVDSFEAWCAGQPELVFFRGHYLLHRAELLLLHGRWSDGLALAEEACARLADPANHLALGGAHYVRGELHRMRGEDDRAEGAYGQAHEAGGSPQPGLALLRLAQGRHEAADAAIRRAVGEAGGPIDRAKLLGAFAEIVLDGGDVDARSGRGRGAGHARRRARLAAPARSWRSVRRRRPARRRRRRRGAGAAAPRPPGLDRPRRTARRSHHPAAARRGVRSPRRPRGGDHGAGGGDRHARALRRRHRPAPAGLTDREVEVLVQLAQGKSNRAIAAALFISEKTVASHVAHIFTKVGVSSRAAATAFAYDHGLVHR